MSTEFFEKFSKYLHFLASGSCVTRFDFRLKQLEPSMIEKKKELDLLKNRNVKEELEKEKLLKELSVIEVFFLVSLKSFLFPGTLAFNLRSGFGIVAAQTCYIFRCLFILSLFFSCTSCCLRQK